MEGTLLFRHASEKYDFGESYTGFRFIFPLRIDADNEPMPDAFSRNFSPLASIP